MCNTWLVYHGSLSLALQKAELEVHQTLSMYNINAIVHLLHFDRDSNDKSKYWQTFDHVSLSIFHTAAWMLIMHAQCLNLSLAQLESKHGYVCWCVIHTDINKKLLPVGNVLADTFFLQK